MKVMQHLINFCGVAIPYGNASQFPFAYGFACAKRNTFAGPRTREDKDVWDMLEMIVRNCFVDKVEVFTGFPGIHPTRFLIDMLGNSKTGSNGMVNVLETNSSEKVQM